jgi:hypothetical protein
MDIGAEVPQSVWCTTADWMTGVQSLAEAKDFSSSLCVQTSSEAHPAYYPVGMGVLPGGEAWPKCDAHHSPHLVLWSLSPLTPAWQ